jgi:hypothetical protein
MPVTLSDEQWARMVQHVSATTNAFSALTQASSFIAKNLGEVADILVEGNQQLVAQQAEKAKPNRATRRTKTK